MTNKFPLQSLGTSLNRGSTVISSRGGWIGGCKSTNLLWFINQICRENFAWIRNSGKNILIIPKVQNLGPKKWMNLQYCRIRKSLKISLWIRNLGKNSFKIRQSVCLFTPLVPDSLHSPCLSNYSCIEFK